MSIETTTIIAVSSVFTAAASCSAALTCIAFVPRIEILLDRIDDNLAAFSGDFERFAFETDDDQPDIIARLDAWSAEQRSADNA